MTTDLAAWLDAAITRREDAARAAARFHGSSWVRPIDTDMVRVSPDDIWFQCLSEEIAEHIVYNDPATVLRRCAADRALIADLTAERHHVNDGDCWYTCAAATEEGDGGETCDDERLGKPCDCGRDNRVGRRLGRIAEGYGRQE